MYTLLYVVALKTQKNRDEMEQNKHFLLIALQGNGL